MRHAATVQAAVLLMLASSCSGADPVPVIEITEATAGSLAGGQVQSSQLTAAGKNPLQHEMLFTLQQLQDEVRMLRGALEEQQYKVARLEQQQRERYRDMDRRISLLMAAMPEEALLAAQSELSSPAEPPESTPVSSDTDKPADNTAKATAATEGSGAYDRAYALVRQRDYLQAEQALEAFLAEFPDSKLVPNAWYWLGEVKLAQGKSEAAAQAFNQVIAGYPDHAKSADALYKLGVLAQRGGDHVRSQQLMQRVLDEYPQTSAAGLARSFLTTQQ